MCVKACKLLTVKTGLHFMRTEDWNELWPWMWIGMMPRVVSPAITNKPLTTRFNRHELNISTKTMHPVENKSRVQNWKPNPTKAGLNDCKNMPLLYSLIYRGTIRLQTGDLSGQHSHLCLLQALIYWFNNREINEFFIIPLFLFQRQSPSVLTRIRSDNCQSDKCFKVSITSIAKYSPSTVKISERIIG